MSAGKRTTIPTVATDLEGGLRIDCYVRPTVSTAADGAIDRVVERLEHLEDDGTVDEYRIVRWPPDGIDGAGRRSTRGEIVAAFERWAERRGCSLEPAFRRRERPSSPLCPGSDPVERVRVPIVTLVLYEGDDGESDETATVRGVVPHTERTGDTDRTYTVDEWLSAAERTGIAVDGPTDERGRSGQATLLEGRQ